MTERSTRSVGAAGILPGGGNAASTAMGLRRHGAMLKSFSRSGGGIIVATLFLFLIGGTLLPETMSMGALSGMVPFAAILAIAAVGQTLVVQQGGIDLTVAGTISLSGVVVCYYSRGAPGEPSSLLTGLGLAFLAATIIGLVVGLLVTKARVAPIVATIGMNAVIYGVNVHISGGTPVEAPAALSRFASSAFWGISAFAYVALAVAVFATVLIKWTVFGRRFEAVGAGARAAAAAGLSLGFYKIAAYVMASWLYCLAGVLLAGLMNLPSAFQGDVYLMSTIAAVVLGGTSLHGGRGNIIATVVAAIFLTQLQQVVLTSGSSVGLQYLFQGAAIIIGVAVYSLNWKGVRARLAPARTAAA